MVKYQIEGDIDFYQELFHSLKDEDEEENGSTSLKEENLCLITNTCLTENFVKLKCGHSFNYLPLYKDILNHKNKFNHMEIKDAVLKISQIRCPYCRTIHNNLIPFIEMEGVEKKHGVNFFDENYEKYLHKFIGECCYLTTNIYFDASKEEDIVSNPKTCKCLNDEVIKIKEDGKDYCSYHKYLAQKQFYKEKLLKEKQALKEAKIQAKLEEKKQKILEKELLKAAKVEAKVKAQKSKLTINLNTNTNTNTNTNLEENIVINTNGCHAILKSGKNIGCHCGNKVFENGKCKRHLQTTV